MGKTGKKRRKAAPKQVKAPKTSRPLDNARHELFAQKVAKGSSSVAAYVDVYGGSREDGPTRGSASELRSKTIVALRIAELQREAAEKCTVEIAEVIRELRLLGFADIAGAFKEDGTLMNPADMPEPVRRAIAGFEVMEEFEGSGRDKTQIGYTKKVKFWEKTKALELLGKHLKMWTDKVEHSGRLTLEQLVAGSNEKEDE